MTYSNIVDNSINSAKPFTIAMPKIHMGGGTPSSNCKQQDSIT